MGSPVNSYVTNIKYPALFSKTRMRSDNVLAVITKLVKIVGEGRI